MNFKNNIFTFILAGAMVIIGFPVKSQQKNSSHLALWYRQPANAAASDTSRGWTSDPEWLKALPVGNGFIGAMVFGGVNLERIQLNEKSLWSGSPVDNNNPDAYASLSKIRQLLFEGKYKEANELTIKTQVCSGVGSDGGNAANSPYGSFQTLGDMILDFGKSSPFTNYRRELDLTNGIVRIKYLQDGTEFEREIFASYPDRALIVRMKAGKKGKISFRAFLKRSERSQTRAQADHLLMTGVLNNGLAGNGMQYASRLKAIVKAGGVKYSGDVMEVKNADEVTLILTAATNYKQEYPKYIGTDPLVTTNSQLLNVSKKTYASLLASHVSDYSALFSKVDLNLSGITTDTIPTDVRLKTQKRAHPDLRLQELYFQYGRYLLISSSREGSLPANLQGIWSNKLQSPWNGDYHVNINLQMNYWPADVTNLSECFGPFIDLTESLVKPGKKTAAVQYKADGWCVHPITNVWGYTSPGEHPGWGMHVAAGGWLGQQIWDHYTFTKDQGYLKRIYPILFQSAQFYLDWLVKNPADGKFVSGPAASPENSFAAPDGSTGYMSMGPSHDQEIIAELFTSVLKASELLHDSNPLLEKIKYTLDNLAAPQIAKDGRLQEWAENFTETDPTHRHVSHLFMLYPGNQVNGTNDNMLDAFKKSLEYRSDVGTGWSLAWKVNFWARLKNGDRAYNLLQNLLQPTDNYKINMSDAGGTYQNLFCGHPPFQIDGNFGATAGMAEMLLQSRDGEIELLPALPSAWRNGQVKGLVARGGYVVDMKWADNEIVSVKIHSRNGGEFSLKYKGRKVNISDLSKQSSCALDSNLKRIN